MNKKDFARLVERDGGCVHCGELEAIAPNHRINRGMGGSKRLDVPSNLVVLCSVLNGLIESDSRWAAVAKEYGWKLSKYDDPLTMPVFSVRHDAWLLLDDSWGYSFVQKG